MTWCPNGLTRLRSLGGRVVEGVETSTLGQVTKRAWPWRPAPSHSGPFRLSLFPPFSSPLPFSPQPRTAFGLSPFAIYDNLLPRSWSPWALGSVNRRILDILSLSSEGLRVAEEQSY